jgi:hypothetical protein
MIFPWNNKKDTEWGCRCDECRTTFTHRDGGTPFKSPQAGLLAEVMHKRGWKTVKGKNPGDPLQWLCPNCGEKHDG